MKVRSILGAGLASCAILAAPTALAQDDSMAAMMEESMSNPLVPFGALGAHLGSCDPYISRSEADRVLGRYKEMVIAAALKEDRRTSRKELEAGFAEDYERGRTSLIKDEQTRADCVRGQELFERMLQRALDKAASR